MRIVKVGLFCAAVVLMMGLAMDASAQEKSPTVFTEKLPVSTVVQDIAASPTKALPAEAYAAIPQEEDLGKELEEPEKPATLFKTQEDVRKLLGDEPRFVYSPRNLPDPMIIPWVRRDVIVREMMEAAQEKIKQGNLL